MIKREAPPIDVVTQVLSEYFHTREFKMERVLRGSSTYVYRVQLGTDTHYLRVLPEQDMSFAVEVQVHSILREKQVSVPEVVYFEYYNEAFGMSMMLVKEIVGSPIEDCPPLVGYKDLLFKAGQQLAIINQVKVNGFGWIKRGNEECGNILQGEKDSLQETLCEFLDEDLFLLSENVFHKDVTSLIRSTLHTGTALMVRHPSYLIHGDFDDSHIFAHNGNFTGIIDFGEIQGNSPLYDLGHFKLHDGQHGEQGLSYDYLAKGYNDIRELSSDDQIEVDLWALWIGVRRLGRGCKLKRTGGSYQDHLFRTVKLQMDRLNKKL